MPDQLPSAILDSSNAFDTLFTLNLDTKQRFDNILSGVQKPIDYPIPDYNKDFTPQGLPQGDLLDPNKMAGSIGEALFSPDVRIAQYATDKLKGMQGRYPINQGVGAPDRFEYAKEMDRYLKGDYGYNPYMSLADNEDFNYRYDYLNQNLAKRIFSNVATGLTRFVGSVGLKLGQTIGYLGAMIGNGVEEIFDSKDNNFMADVADNSLSRWFEGLEEDMKTSNLLSVFKPRDWDDRGFFNKLGHGAFWTDEVADGAAFMGEMVASMYLLGGLGRIGALGKFGATEINLTKSLSKLGNLGKNTGRALDGALKLSTGANNLSGVGRWAFATTSESAFEAAQLFKERKERLKADRENGLNEYSDLEIETIAGDSAAATFKANMLILSASNAFENRFIFGPLFKKLGLDTGPTNSKASLIDINKSVDSLDDIAKASRRTYNYKTYLGKKLDWKNSNSRGRFYGSRALSATAAEGFWEENAQLAAERLASANNLSLTSFLAKMKSQTIAALKGEDPEASTSIGLGAGIGSGATTVISKIRGGNRLFQGERRQIESHTLQTIEIYEQFRKGFLNYQDIYIRDPQTGKPVMDSDGNLQIDEVKAAGLLDGTNKFVSKQAAADKVADPLFRKHLQDEAMRDYVVAAKMAGIYNKAEQVFETLKDVSPEQLTNLGFDPNSTVDSVYLRDSLKQFGTIYDSVQKAPPPRFKKGDTPQDDVRRRADLYEASTAAYSATKIIGEYQSKMLDKDFPSVFSPEAEANTSEVQQYNSLLHQRYALNQFDEMTAENTEFFKGYVSAERRRISAEMERLEGAIDIMLNPEEGEPIDLEQDELGFVYTPSKYEGYSDVEGRLMFEVEMDSQKKHAEYTNIRNQNQYLVNKFSNQETGIENSKAYRAYLESMHKRDQEVDDQQNPPTTPPATGPAAPPASPPVAPPAIPTSPTPTTAQAAQGADITNNLQGLLDTATTDIKEGRQPDFPTLTNFIVDNQSTHEALISKQLLDFLTQFGNIVAESIRNGTYVPNSPDELEYIISTLVIGEIIQDTRIVTPIVDGISAYVNQLEEAKKAFLSVPLNDAEKTAVQVISEISGLENSSIAPYTSVISDPNASDADKRQALRGLSDQYLAPETSDIVYPLLTPEAREALDNLGYPVPDLGTDVDTIESTRSAEELAAGAGIIQTPEGTLSIPPEGPLVERISDRLFQRYPAQIKGLDTAKLRRLAAIDTEVEEVLPKEYFKDDNERLEDEYGEIAANYARTMPYNKKITRAEAQFFKDNPDFEDFIDEMDYINDNRPRDQKLTGIEMARLFLDEAAEVVDSYQLAMFGPQVAPDSNMDTPTLEQRRQAALDSIELESADEGSGNVMYMATVDGQKWQDFEESDLRDRINQKFDNEAAGIIAPVVVEANTAKEPVQADESLFETLNTQSDPPEASGTGTPPPVEPPPPQVAENSDEEALESDNYIDILVDNSKLAGDLLFPETMPAEVVMEGDQAKITNGAIQLKSTTGDQQRQVKRAHNIKKQMGDRNKPINFWSEDAQGNLLYKIKLEIGNEEKHGQWVHDTGKGLINQATGRPNKFSFIVAMVVDQQGEYVYFDDNGNISNKTKGMPFGFAYTVEDYKPLNLKFSRRGIQLKTGELLNGQHGFLTPNPLQDLRDALYKGVNITGTILEVASGKLSSYNVDNSGATYAKTPVQRTVKEMIESGDITDDTPFVLSTGEFTRSPVAVTSDTEAQLVKVGQPYLLDEKSGLKIPLRGKKLKDLTLDGKPLLSEEIRTALEELSTRGFTQVTEGDPTPEQIELLENMYNYIRALIYSKNTPIFMNAEKSMISMLDQRTVNIPLLETELNYSSNIEIMRDPFDTESEGFTYQDFLKENFLSGAIPAELNKDEKSFEKLNRRIIFILDKNHQEILDSTGSTARVKTVRTKTDNYPSFINKTYKQRGGGESTVTITGFADGNFTISGPKGTIIQPAEDFMKQLPNLEEVKLPAPSEDVINDFENNIKLSQDKQKELNEKARTMSKTDLDDLNFDC